MSAYTVKGGDTFESISRRNYGSEKGVTTLMGANPGVSEPLVPGLVITVPTLPDAPQNVSQKARSDNPDETAVLIEGTRFRFWERVHITRSIDSFDAIELEGPFDSKAQGYREAFKPFTYRRIEVTVGGEPLFTGTMFPRPALRPGRKSINVTGYSRPAVLTDCTMPVSAYPIEFDKFALRPIAEYMARPFGLSVVFTSPEGAIFDRVASEPGEKVIAFLSKLAKKRGLIISSTPKGELLFLKEATGGKPVARLRQGESPLIKVVPRFEQQDCYSDITGLEPVVMGLKGSSYSVKNTQLRNVVRPFTMEIEDTLDADMKTAVETKIANMFGSMAVYPTTVDTWRDPSGELWAPNTLVTLLAPDAMVYKEYTFLVRAVTFIREADTEKAKLHLVFPGVYSGKFPEPLQLPESLPWD